MFPSIDFSNSPVFNESGQFNPGIDNKQLLSVPGFNRTAKLRHAKSLMQFEECATMWAAYLSGNLNPFLMREALCGVTEDFAYAKLQKLAPTIFNEAMSLSDFSNLTMYVLDRVMLAAYPKYPSTWDQFAKINRNVKDFRNVDRWVTDGGESVWQQVGELATFNRINEVTGKYSYGVNKFEKGYQISWEAYINDDMGQFNDLAQRIATGGARTLEQFWLKMIAGTTGPKSSLFGTAISMVTGGTIKNIIDTSAFSDGNYSGHNNPALDVMSVILAAGQFMNQVTAEGRPIDIAQDKLGILVGDGIMFQKLKQIINTNQISTTLLGGAKGSGSSAADLTLQSKNWIAGNLVPVYAPELRNIVTASNLSTSWWLFPMAGGGRPIAEIGFLAGYDTPVLYKKAPDTQRISGGLVEEMGSFETMATEVKGLLVFGGTGMDPRMAMASNGSNS